MANDLIRIAVFYDGTYFMKISEYFKFAHSRSKYLAFSGVQEFFRHKVAEKEKSDFAFCQIVESHFFRGRFSLAAAKAKSTAQVEKDRYIDQIIMKAGITTHYLPMKETTIKSEEKGIDVWLALEAYDLAVHKRFDVLVLCAGDGDFVPLARKINSIGTRVMLIGTSIPEYKDQNGNVHKPIQSAQPLIDEVTYPIIINEEIDSKANKNDSVIDGCFE